MRRLKQAADRFFEDVQIEGGAKTRALIKRPSDNDQPGIEFAYPRLTARVLRHSILKSGDVIQVADAERYLLADHSTTTEYRTHHMFLCDRMVSWTRKVEVIDPVTKLKKSDGEPVLIGNLWVMWERTRREFMDLSIRIAQESALVATGADVQLGDLINGMKVKRVNHALGINVVELMA